MRFWNSVKVTALPALIAGSVLGTAVLAQQGRDAGRAKAEAGLQAAPSRGSADESSSPQKEPIWRAEIEGNRTASQGTEALAGEGSEGTRQIQNETARVREMLDKIYKQQDTKKKTEHIRELLARKSELDFPNGVPLKQFLKAIKSATATKDDPGISIYVNPVGMQEANRTLESLVDAVPGNTLANVLEQAVLGVQLGYELRDGFLCIDSLGIVESKLEEKLDRLMNALESKPPRPESDMADPESIPSGRKDLL